ncbi:hypothetical protein QE109_10215 [Fusibacter bizertensis]|jgi:hypothetical protein|uniref:Uncharacterized protein n=1 Tax=Fusibacter bizertensis TaxID=1488331 RepID=A0ABT6NDP2_9FIRM|nr:hypothetical protein [Fusibacter bizertensis]MDH8678522.1 hypothetical protein [Fusibacter bizertensis]
MESFELLYKWKIVDCDKTATVDTIFIEFEKRMAEHGIRTKVEKCSDGFGFELSVPLKDYDVAYGIYSGEVHSIIDKPGEIYHVFEDDLTFKNSALYDDPYKGIFKYNRLRNYLFIALVLVIMLFIFKFVKIP